MLEASVEDGGSDGVPVATHGAEHLDVLALDAVDFGDLMGHEVGDEGADVLGGFYFYEFEIRVDGSVEGRGESFVDLVCVGDDAGVLRLSVDGRESDRLDDIAFDEVAEHASGADAGELVDVAYEDESASFGDSLEQGIHQERVDHRDFVDDDDVFGERAIFVTQEGTLLVFQEAVYG